jgi:hypothetical protein
MTAKGKKTAGANGKPVGDPQDRLLADVEILRTSEPMSEVYHDAQARCLRALPQLLALLAQREGDLARWERLFLDKPEDRLFHASDKTWWQRKDDTYLGKGGLFSAAPPEYVQRLEDDLSFVRTELARVKAEYEELLASKKRALEMLKRAQAPQVERFMTATATMPAERQVEPATPATGRSKKTAEVWLRTGHWPSRKFPAEFSPDAPVRYRGRDVAVTEVPVGETFSVLSSRLDQSVPGSAVAHWEKATRVAPPRTVRLSVDVEVDGDVDPGDALSLVQGNLDVKDFRSVNVTRATNGSAPRAKVKRASGKAKRASATG